MRQIKITTQIHNAFIQHRINIQRNGYRAKVYMLARNEFDINDAAIILKADRYAGCHTMPEINSGLISRALLRIINRNRIFTGFVRICKDGRDAWDNEVPLLHTPGYAPREHPDVPFVSYGKNTSVVVYTKSTYCHNNIEIVIV
jgi:hypothetical protein